MNFKTIYSITLIAALGGQVACTKEDDDKAKGSSIGAPAIQPPVVRNLPTGLGSANLLLDDAVSNKDTAINAIKELLAPSGGLVGVVQRLEKIDQQMAELDVRAQADAQRACLADGVVATSYDIGGKFPGAQTIEMNFQCQEDLKGGLSDGHQLAFGKTSSEFFLMNRAPGSLATFARAPLDGTGATIWQIAVGTEQTSFMQIKATDGVGFEATVAGTDVSGQSGASPCGIQLKSNSSLIYVAASVAASGGCSAQETYCLNAATLADASAATECTTAGLSTFTLTSLTPALAEAAVTDAAAIVNQKISGFIDFTENTEVAKP